MSMFIYWQRNLSVLFELRAIERGLALYSANTNMGRTGPLDIEYFMAFLYSVYNQYIS